MKSYEDNKYIIRLEEWSTYKGGWNLAEKETGDFYDSSVEALDKCTEVLDSYLEQLELGLYRFAVYEVIYFFDGGFEIAMDKPEKELKFKIKKILEII